MKNIVPLASNQHCMHGRIINTWPGSMQENNGVFIGCNFLDQSKCCFSFHVWPTIILRAKSQCCGLGLSVQYDTGTGHIPTNSSKSIPGHWPFACQKHKHVQFEHCKLQSTIVKSPPSSCWAAETPRVCKFKSKISHGQRGQFGPQKPDLFGTQQSDHVGPETKFFRI